MEVIPLNLWLFWFIKTHFLVGVWYTIKCYPSFFYLIPLAVTKSRILISRILISRILSCLQGKQQHWFRWVSTGKFYWMANIWTLLNGLEKYKCSWGIIQNQLGILYQVILGLKIIKVRQISSSQPMGSCMSWWTLEKINVKTRRSTS